MCGIPLGTKLRGDSLHPRGNLRVGRDESGDDLDPSLASGFGRLGGVGVDGGLTGCSMLDIDFSN